MKKIILLFLMFAFLCLFDCEDFILTDFNRKEFVQIGQDFSIYKEYVMAPEATDAVRNLNAGRFEKNITLYWINDKQLIQARKFGTDGALEETKTIDLKKTQISSFDMSSDYRNLFISNNDGIYQFDVQTSETTEVLEKKFVTALSIHYEKKLLYYSDCQNGRGLLVTRDLQQKEDVEKVQLNFCFKGIIYDVETGILFAHTKNEIYEKTPKANLMELRYFRSQALISSMAAGFKYLFFVDFQQNENDIYKLPKIPKPIEMVLPITYDIPPHIVNTEDGLIVLSVADQKLLKLNRNYGVKNEISIEVEKKKIRSLKYKRSPSSEKLFWIHHHNAGIVVSVEIKNNKEIVKKNIAFEIPRGTDLMEIETDDSDDDNLFLAYDNAVYFGKISDSSVKDLADVDSTVYSMRKIPNAKILIISGCTETNGEITNLIFEHEIELNSHKLKTCIQKLDLDGERIIFGSSPNAIYYIVDGANKMVKLCSTKDAGSLVVDNENVYFTADSDKHSGKKLFRIKKWQAKKSDDLLTEQRSPALVAFIKDIPGMNEKSDSMPKFSKCSKIKNSLLLSVFLIMLVL